MTWTRAVTAVVVLVAVQVPVAARSAVAAVSGAELVTRTSGNDSQWQKEVAVACPPGKKVTGGGGRVIDGEGYVALTQFVPLSGLEHFRAVASEVPGGYGGDWEVEVFAVCTDPLPGLELVATQVNAAPGANYAEAFAVCPAGKRVVGAGGRVGYADVNVGDSLYWVRPFAEFDYVWASAVHDSSLPPSLGFPVVAYAVCAFEPAGYEIRSSVVPAGGASSTGRMLQATARCTGTRRILGAGLGGDNFSGTAHVDEVFPARDRRAAWAVSRQPAAANTYRLGASAICAD